MIWKSFILFLTILMIQSCIDRVDFDTRDVSDEFIVVEGMISDQPGPYTIKIYRPSNVVDNLLNKTPIPAKDVIISDDLGNSERLTSPEVGVYKTSETGIRGVIGRKYKLNFTLYDGGHFESSLEEMRPSGQIDSIYYEFADVEVRNGPNQHGFKVFADSRSNSAFMRWKFTGIYKAFTFPEKHTINNACVGQKYPPTCSGYTLIDGYGYARTGDCTCCVCWLYEPEEVPHLNDLEIATNGIYKRVELGFIPFDVWRFYYKKYMVKVEQMSLSKEAYEFWNLIKDQKENVASLFQPAIGKLTSNILSHDSNIKVIGVFYAASIQQRVIFITGANPQVPYPDFDTPPEEFCFLFDACDKVYDYLNASRLPPPEWK